MSTKPFHSFFVQSENYILHLKIGFKHLCGPLILPTCTNSIKQFNLTEGQNEARKWSTRVLQTNFKEERWLAYFEDHRGTICSCLHKTNCMIKGRYSIHKVMLYSTHVKIEERAAHCIINDKWSHLSTLKAQTNKQNEGKLTRKGNHDMSVRQLYLN